MLIGDLLPAALAAWKPRRATHQVAAQTSDAPIARSPSVRPKPIAVPHGVLALAPETRTVLSGALDFARSRYVELQMAVEPGVVAQVDAVAYRTCLHDLLSEAIVRAASGVLVTAVRQGDGVEVAVLDDGSDSTGPRRDGSTQVAAVPPGASLVTDSPPQRGTTVLLRLPRSNWLPRPSDVDAVDHGASADL